MVGLEEATPNLPLSFFFVVFFSFLSFLKNCVTAQALDISSASLHRSSPELTPFAPTRNLTYSRLPTESNISLRRIGIKCVGLSIEKRTTPTLNIRIKIARDEASVMAAVSRSPFTERRGQSQIECSTQRCRSPFENENAVLGSVPPRRGKIQRP